MIHLLHVGAPSEIASRLPKAQVIRVKMDIATAPPSGASTETLTQKFCRYLRS